ncbi:MAG: hypothetical protein KIG63_07805 [Methanobrevibacter sp.]|nr:hypothetical protein [Methanobrevibacter sp.]
MEMISINDFKIIPECGKCKHADLYIPYWLYPYGEPKCSVHHKIIKSDDAGKHKIRRKDIGELEKIVKSKGLLWRKF